MATHNQVEGQLLPLPFPLAPDGGLLPGILLGLVLG